MQSLQALEHGCRRSIRCGSSNTSARGRTEEGPEVGMAPGSRGWRLLSWCYQSTARSGLRGGGVDPAVELKSMQDKFKDGTEGRMTNVAQANEKSEYTGSPLKKRIDLRKQNASVSCRAPWRWRPRRRLKTSWRAFWLSSARRG